MTYGIDIGSSQSGMNLYTAKTQGIQFAVVKLGGANVLPLYVAPAYTNEVFRAISIGMPVGHYWVTGAGDATAQADYFTSHLAQFDKNSQILALDNETLDSNGETWTDAKIATWINRVVANTGIDPQRIWLYMSASAVRNATTFSQTIATGCRFWVAVWGSNDGTRITPDLGGKWPTWHVQQYWSNATVAGYTTDKNYSPLSIADLFNPGPSDPGPTGTVDGTLYDDSPSLWEDGSTGGNGPPIGKNPLEKCVYRNGQWIVYWGKNATPPPPPPPPPGIARFAGTGSLINGSTPPPPKPVANFTWTQTAGTFAVAFVNTSTQTAGSIVGSVWNFGDGTATSTAANPTHSYPQVTATYTVTLTVTDSFGQTASKATSVSVTSAPPPPPPPPPSGAKYAIGNMYDGYSSGQTIQQNITAAGGRVYTFADLGLTTATTNLQTIVDKLPGNGVIQLPANWTGYINSFNHHGSNFGIFQPRLMGLLGNITNGQITTTIKVGPNAETATQAWSLGWTTNGVPRAAKLGDTTQVGAYHLNNSLPHFIAGIRFQGTDQIKATDTSNNRTGPAIWAGFFFNRAGAKSIVQNIHMQGFGRADDSTPPGEIGNWGESHTVGLLFRRLEHDGMIPHTSGATDPYGMAWRRGGGIQWSQAGNFLMEDVYSHDTWASGLTMSFTSVPIDHSNMSHDFTTRRLLVAHNSHHGTAPGNQTSGAFAAINMEFCYGTVHHYQPHFGIIDGGLGANKGHIQLWMYSSNLGGAPRYGDPSLNLIVHQPVWENSGPQYNDCFVIRYSGLKTINGKYPTVYLTSDETKPAKVYVMSASSTAPSTITKANNYYILTY